MQIITIAGLSSPPASPGQISNVDHLVLPGPFHQSEELCHVLGFAIYVDIKISCNHFIQVLGEKAIAVERIWAFASDSIQPILFILFFIVQVLPYHSDLVLIGL